jgi:nitrogen regulatory protein PII
MDESKYTLPFEVVQDVTKQEGKIQAGLKRVEVFVSSDKADAVLAAINGKQFEATMYDSKGFGEQKEKVRVGRGLGEAQLAYSTRRTIVTIIDSGKLEEVVNTIKSAVTEVTKENSGGGVIAISPMDALLHV